MDGRSMAGITAWRTQPVATHRICGFVQAYTGNVLQEDATEEQKKTRGGTGGTDERIFRKRDRFL